MGSNLQKVNGQEIKPLETIQDEYFGNSQLFSVQNRQRCIIKADIKSNLKDFQAHIKLNHPGLAKTWNYDSDLTEVFGLKTQGTKFYFDYYETSFQKIIQARKKRNQYFTLSEVLKITNSLLDVLAYMQWNTVAHWDINPRSVFYDKQNKQVMIYDNELLYGKQIPYRKWLSGYPTYVTPEAMKAVKSRDPSGLDSVRYQSDIYLLGLFLLEVCTLESSINCCNKDTLKMDQKVIDQRLALVHFKFGFNYHNLIKEMLNEDPSKRLPAKTLLERFITPSTNSGSNTQIPAQISTLPQTTIAQPNANIQVPIQRLQTLPSQPSLTLSTQLPMTSSINLAQSPRKIMQIVVPPTQSSKLLLSQVLGSQQSLVRSQRLASPTDRIYQSQIVSPIRVSNPTFVRAKSPEAFRQIPQSITKLDQKSKE